MRTVGRAVWITLSVGAAGLLMGIGLMMVGDLLGQRDETALRMVVSPSVPRQAAPETTLTPSPSLPAVTEIPQPLAVVTQTLTALQQTLSAPTPEAIAKAAEAITVISEHERSVNRGQLVQAVESPLQFLSQSRMLPHMDGLKPDGVQVASLIDSPWTQKVGLRVGDVITQFNGKSILDPRHFPSILSELQTAPAIQLTIQRGGQDVTLSYTMQAAVQALVPNGTP